MARKRDFIFELYYRTLGDITANAENWKAFLRAASRNYKLRFDEQVLVYAQKPNATAVARIESWNEVYGRWVNKGARGIAVFDGSVDKRSRLEHYFDISDTHESRRSRAVSIWEMKPEYEKAITETLENSFGELEDNSNFVSSIFSASENAVLDNISDYFDEMQEYLDEDSLVLGIDEIETSFEKLVRNSMAYMIFSRLKLEDEIEFPEDAFEALSMFSTERAINYLGFATSDIAETALREISSTVRDYEKENRTFESEENTIHNEENDTLEIFSAEEEISINEERSDSNGNDLHADGRLPVSESGNERNSETRQIRKDESGLPKETQESDILQSAPSGRTGEPSDRDTAISGNANGFDNERNDEELESGRATQSRRSNEMGGTDEQHQTISGGDNPKRTDIQLDEPAKELKWHDKKTEEKNLPFFSAHRYINEYIISAEKMLSVSLDDIAEFYHTNDDEDSRIEYLQKAFGNAYTSIFFKVNGEEKEVGYKTYQNVLHLWTGKYLTRDTEAYYSWSDISAHISAMILMRQIGTTNRMPSVEINQLSLFDDDEEIVDKNDNETFRFTDEIIDEVLLSGSGFAQGKFRIYSHFIDTENTENSASFLKDEYGTGGRMPAIFGSRITELHDAKGITLRHDDVSYILSWSNVSKKIKNLIENGKYLTADEKEQYNAWVLESITETSPITTNEEKEEPEAPTTENNVAAKDVPKINFKISDDNLGHGGTKAKFNANIRAIETLQEIESENRLATEDEQEILSRYVSFGSLPMAFDPGNAEWRNEYNTLKSILSDDEYENARETTLNAFYTAPVVIKAMYKAVENMGFTNGNILEPSCGIGNFMGLLPDRLGNSSVYGVELDSLTGRIARQLYQRNSISITGFEDKHFDDSFFDIAIGNVPFGGYGVADKRYDKHHFLIHDYFFAKTLDKVRAGGIIAFVTSKGTLDKKNPAVRKYIAERAELLGAIRLPNDTFTANAGTGVTTDIIFLQKRDRIIDVEPDWVHLDATETGIPVNSYFVSNPDMILGEMNYHQTMFGNDKDTTCTPFPNSDLSEQLEHAIQNIHAEILEYEREDDDEDISIPADPEVRNFSYCLVGDDIYYRKDSRMTPSDLSVTGANRVRGMIKIRDSARKLIEYQTENYPDEDITNEQKTLNNLYDEYTKKYGLLNSRGNSMAFSEDSSYPLLCSLEILDAEGNLLRKADMFSKRTIKPLLNVMSVDTASEALAVSIGEKACVDINFMQELTGLSEEEITGSLEGVIFRNVSEANLTEIPKTSEEIKQLGFTTADDYLSGNVREKLRNVKAITEIFPDTLADLTPNIEALEKVVPKDLSASEISVRLGSTWIPVEYINDFMYEILDTPNHAKRYVMIHYSEHTASWNVEGKSFDRGNITANSTYGTSRISAYKIIEESLNLRDVRIFDVVYDDDGNKTSVLNKKETTLARGKQEQIKDAFSKWLFNEPERREKIVRLYNDLFNSMRTRQYDGSHINFSGINPEIELYDHQKNAIARIMYGGNSLLAHVVGAGKTFTMTAAAMESKRLGLCNKSLFVVPNHLTEQWASEFLQLYPSANILVATKKDFEMKNRRKFCSRISTGDYDAVIIGHSQLEKIPISPERQERLLRDQIEDIQLGINELKQQNGERFSVKQMEKSKKMLMTKLKKLTSSKKDDVVTFEELGIDRLFIDEAHNYKNLYLYTKMRNVGGIAQTEAAKSSDLFAKCRYLDEITGSKGTIFATGTPISNSMVELYTMQRYLQYDLLSKHNLQHFDSWASTFGETVSAIELAPEGTGYRMKTRFAKFFNLPELMTIFKQTADIQTSDMLNLPVPEAHFHNIAIMPSDIQKEMVLSLSERAEKVRSKAVAPNIDNMLLITNDGRKLALDERLINEMLPANDNGKVAVCADNVYRIWNDSKEKRLTQLVFCDLSTPKNNDKFNIYDEMKKRLLNRGVPESEIAFIHSAGTDSKKKELFAKVRTGSVRILLGSTAKMGAGTNVQDLLIASHDVDCPWRPADLEQRAGRIIRQGNSNPKVDLYRYVTEQTFDAYLYQIIENKQKFIGQIMTSKSPVRSAEDIDETALSYAEIKALATGNPHIKEKMDLDIEVAKLKVLRAGFFEQKYNLQDKIVKVFPAQIEHQIEKIKGYEIDVAHLKKNTLVAEDKLSPMVIDGTSYSDRMEAGKALITACNTIKSSDSFHIGSYRGFKMDLSFNAFDRVYVLKLKNNLSHKVELGADISGNITRINNVLDSMEKKLEDSKEMLTHSKQQLENAKVEVEKSFPQEEELSTKTERLTELNELLSMDEKDLSATELDEESPEQESDERSYER